MSAPPSRADHTTAADDKEARDGAAGFGIDHLPYGLFSTADSLGRRRPGVRIGSCVLDVGALARARGLDWASCFSGDSLNPFLAARPAIWATARGWLREQLGNSAYPEALAQHLHAIADVHLHLPIEVADYVDFYASEHHAGNIGAMLRPKSPALTPNWKHLPIAYHGRSSTEPGQVVTVDQAADHIFGVALFNDWSARDIQAWEYVPLGRSLASRSPARWQPGSRRWRHRGGSLPVADTRPGAAAVLARSAAEQFRTRHRHDHPAERRGDLDPALRLNVLVTCTDAGAPQRPRRGHQRRRCVSLRDRLRPGSAHPRVLDGVVVERHRANHPGLGVGDDLASTA